MEYLYYKAKKGNFGDDLNEWLWPKIFGPNNTQQDYFVGIGSILFNDNKLFKNLAAKKKIVFGSGIRPAYKPFVPDNTWDIKFLRGPLSAGALGNKYKFITDAAYAIRALENFAGFINVPKKYEVSVMPYFHSVEFFNWQLLFEELGYHYISPLSENGVEHTLNEIAASKTIITEAMHGAILADALRVPWNRFVLSTPYTEGAMISEFKWMDWLYSVNVLLAKPVHIKFYRNSFVNRWLKGLTAQRIDVKFLLKKMVRKDILHELAAVKNFYLSKDEVLQAIDKNIQREIMLLQKEQSIKQ